MLKYLYLRGKRNNRMCSKNKDANNEGVRTMSRQSPSGASQAIDRIDCGFCPHGPLLEGTRRLTQPSRSERLVELT